ncbi:MAG: CoA transferase [Candidatus Rokubacteria bacterium]|nr:CoA transferase [Candidatus Rokubacteria bacterium]
MTMAESSGPLAGYRVLDLTDARGVLCGKILADLGADVVKVEPPGGNPVRSLGPFAGDIQEPERSLHWWAYAANCRSLLADLETPEGMARVRDLAGRADFLLESLPPGRLDRLGLGWEALKRANPRLILTSITPFGQTGPYRDWKGPDLVVQGMAGMMFHLGDSDRPPVRIGVPQAYLQAAAQAAVGTLVAHSWRERTGQGQWVEVSAQVAMMWTMMSETGLPALHGFEPFRDGVHARYAGFRRRIIFPCADGFVALIASGGAIGGPAMEALTAWMDEEGMAPDFMRGRDWRAWDAAYLLGAGERGQAELDQVEAAAARFFATKTKGALYEGALARGVLLAPVADTRDLLENAQLAARDFFVPVTLPRVGRQVVHPGPFARFSVTPTTLRRPAPSIGEHTADVLPSWERTGATERGHACDPSSSAPFEGIRVIDLAWVATGPITGRLLAEFGADVIRLESATRIDPGRTLPPWADREAGPNRSQLFANYNAGKRSVALNLSHPKALEIARQLIAQADVVVESFTPGTMARWGLGYPDLRSLKPDIILLSTCQQGQTGPHSHYAGYGSLAAALAGFYALTGWPDREPAMIYGAYTDFVAHHFASAALLAALDHRRRTGEGQHVDLSQFEASLHFLAPAILDYAVNGRVAARRGNRDDGAAPHNAYPCAGPDRWCVIVCEDEADWRSLCRIMGEPEWCRRPEFASQESRRCNAEELDRLIGQWTVAQDPASLARQLQAVGVPGGVVQSCSDLHRDPQLSAWGAFRWLDHPEIGRAPYEAWPFRCSETPGQLRPAPCLGEHTHAVMTELLGMSRSEVDGLIHEGVLR